MERKIKDLRRISIYYRLYDAVFVRLDIELQVLHVPKLESCMHGIRIGKLAGCVAIGIVPIERHFFTGFIWQFCDFDNNDQRVERGWIYKNTSSKNPKNEESKSSIKSEETLFDK